MWCVNLTLLAFVPPRSPRRRPGTRPVCCSACLERMIKPTRAYCESSVMQDEWPYVPTESAFGIARAPKFIHLSSEQVDHSRCQQRRREVLMVFGN